MNNLNLAQNLIKKKPESELRLLVQKHSSGIEHRSESNTPNRQKKARELRSGFSIQFRGYTFMNDANLPQQVIEDNTDFLIGDLVVIRNHIMGHMQSDSIFCITEYKEDFLGAHVSMIDPHGMTWTSGTKHIRPVTVAELNAKRRLTKAEQALAEVP